MTEIDKIVFEFNPETRVLHLFASERIDISTKSELDELCCHIRGIIKENAGTERIYMVVDLRKIDIDPKLADMYGKKISEIYKDHILPGGLVRYGLEITRVTIKVGQAKYMDETPLLFRSKEAAMAYINSLIEKTGQVT